MWDKGYLWIYFCICLMFQVSRPGSKTNKMTVIALLVAVGLILFVFESYIPKPFPWMRIGLGNLSTLLALSLYGVKEALIVTLIRICLGGLLVGTIFNPIFLLAFGGGLTSLFVMSLVWRFSRQRFSLIGISIWGATAHNVTQLLLTYFVLVKRVELFYLLPTFLLPGLLAGFIIGLIAYFVLDKLRRIPYFY